MTYTMAYNASCESGWADRRGNLFGCVVEEFDDKETAERIAEKLNADVGYNDCFGGYLEFFVEELGDNG